MFADHALLVRIVEDAVAIIILFRMCSFGMCYKGTQHFLNNVVCKIWIHTFMNPALAGLVRALPNVRKSHR